MALADQLFAPLVAPERRHPNFRRVVENGSEAERGVLRRWANGFVDRDGKFVREFQTTFNSSFWELYVFAVLRSMGLGVDMSHPRPDFCVRGGPLVEAVVAGAPQTGIPEWVYQPPTEGPERETLLDLATSRLAQAVSSKNAKWKNEYEQLAHCSGKAFVIAVAPFEQPMGSYQGTEAISRVLYGTVAPVVLSGSEDEPDRVVGTAAPPAVFKSSGAAVPVGLFSDAAYSGVSGVLFSSLATWSKVHALAGEDASPAMFSATRLQSGGRVVRDVAPVGKYREGLIDGLHLFLNPLAERPMDFEQWLRHGIAVHSMDGERLTSIFPADFLIQRTAIRLRLLGPGDQPTKPALPPDGVREHQRAYPPDRVLYGGPAVLGANDEVMLTLYRGWTICSGCDLVDRDWLVMAKSGRYLSLQEFVDASGMSEFLGKVHPSRESAIGEACAHIDQCEASTRSE